jgi:hypothetical protein
VMVKIRAKVTSKNLLNATFYSTETNFIRF